MYGSTDSIEGPTPSTSDRARFEDAKQHALRLLNRRMYSRRELQLKLEEKGHAHDVARAAAEYLEGAKVINDRQYAESFARTKWRTLRWAPAKIRVELSRRGLSEDHIHHGLKEVFGPGYERAGVEVREAEDLGVVREMMEEAAAVPVYERSPEQVRSRGA
jgi:SOS response regulatory protein OraA/RecX